CWRATIRARTDPPLERDRADTGRRLLEREPRNHQLTRKVTLQLFAHGQLQLARLGGLCFSERGGIGGDRYLGGGLPRRPPQGLAAKRAPDPRRLQPPLSHEPVAGQALL